MWFLWLREWRRHSSGIPSSTGSSTRPTFASTRHSAGTSAGFHQYDEQLEDFTSTAIQQQITTLHRYEQEVSQFPAGQLTPEQAADRDLVLGTIRSWLLDLESIRIWEKNPDHYSSTTTNAVFVIMARTFASPEERLRSLIARERQMPEDAGGGADETWKNPPRIYTEVAIEQMPGMIGFFQKDVPSAFTPVKDAALLTQFHRANGAVIGAGCRRMRSFLKNDLLPRSNGDFRLGADNYRKKLLYDEMVDIPLDRLLEIGFANLRQNQQAFRETAKKIDVKKTAQEILTDAEKDHPAPDKLLQTFRDTLGGAARSM